MENLATVQIRRDGGTQPRAALDEATIRDYAEAMQRGDTFPAVVVFFDGTDYWLADGFHRLAALQSLSALDMQVPAIVHQGDQRAAIFFSTGVNAEHGLRRSNADKRRAVEVLLRDKEWGTWADREIARQCKVSHEFVRQMRPICQPLTDNTPTPTPTERTVTRSGTTYTMNTAPIGPSRPPAQVVYTGVRDTATGGQGDTGTGGQGDAATPEITVEATGPGIRTQEAVDMAAAKVRWQVRAFLKTNDGPAADRATLEEAKRLTGGILDLEGFAARRGRNFDWEALVRAWPMTEPTSLRRAVELEREVVLALLAVLPEVEAEAKVEAEDEPADLAAVVIHWLDAKIEENAIPAGAEESRYVLRGILTGRYNGFALAWRELKQQGHWPAGTQDGAKLDAVKAALAQLGGEVPAPPAPVERVYVRPDLVPTTAQAMNEVDRLNKKLRDLVDLNAKQAERIHGQVVAIDKALGYLKSLAIGEEEAIDEDLIETIAALEAAR